MKIAVLLDSLELKGGGEKIAYYLTKHYNADIYTSTVAWDKILPEFKRFNIKVFEGIPRSMFLKPEALIKKFRSLDLSGYDATICLGSGYTYFTAIKNHPVIWYTFGISPLFYSSGPETQKYWALGRYYFKPIIWLWKKRIKRYDRETMHNQVDAIVSPSKFTGDIIKKYYSRDYELIKPPIELTNFYNRPNKGYYIIISRFVPEKRINIVIEAFKKLPKKTLFIEGSGPQDYYLRKLAGNSKNIQFLGRVSSQKLRKLYAECIALISVAYFQDINMVIIEALASGKPCITVKQGAFPETIKDGKNGVFVEGTVDGVIQGVNRLTSEKAEKMKDNCIKSAQAFDLNVFYKKWDAIIERLSK